jgi:hypothetical protein
MKNLIKALRVAFEAFKMVYRGWTITGYEKFEDNGYSQIRQVERLVAKKEQ